MSTPRTSRSPPCRNASRASATCTPGSTTSCAISRCCSSGSSVTSRTGASERRPGRRTTPRWRASRCECNRAARASHLALNDQRRRLVGSPTVEVRPCDESDLPLLAQALPLEGRYDHAYRFRGQQAGRWCYLLALEPGPVGACLVHWDGPTHDVVHRLLPDVVEVTSLYVAPHARGRGAGRTLMQDAERRAAQG